MHTSKMKETEDDTKKWKDIQFLRMEIKNIVKMSIPKAMYTLSAIPIKYQQHFSELK